MAQSHAQPSVRPYLQAASVSLARFAPDGGLVFVSNLTGRWEAFRADTDAKGPAWPDRLTFLDERVGDVYAVPGHDATVIVAADRGGDERWQLLAVSPGEVRDIDPGDGVMRHMAAPAPDGRTFAFSSNRRDTRFFDLYLTDLDGAAPRLVYQQDSLLYPLAFSPDGSRLLVRERRPSRDEILWLFDLDGGRVSGPRLLARGPEHAVSRFLSAAFSPDGATVYAVSDAGREFLCAIAIDATSGERRVLYAPEADVEEAAPSPDGRQLALVENVRGAGAIRLLDLGTGAPATLVPADGVVHGLDWHGGRLAFVRDRAGAGVDVFVLDRVAPGVQARPLTRSPVGGLDRSAFVAPEEVRVLVRDGLEVPAWLYRPVGAKAPYAAVWSIHGGPEAQARPGFDAVTQFLLAAGVAVVKPNVRGSTGYGRTYEHADDRLNRLESVDDLKDLWHHLVDGGILDPRRQAVMGASYGGYMTLATLTRHPELWCAGVDIVGIASFITLLERTSPWRRPVREAEYGSLVEDRAFLETVSPIAQAERLTAPLFVVHGAKDPRVPVEEAELIVSFLRERQREVEYLRFEDEGHGLSKLTNRLIAYDAIAAFLLRHLA